MLEVMYMKKNIEKTFYWHFKRLVDIILSLVLIIITLPITLIVLLITYIDIGKPLIDIRIPREGLYKKPFYMYKIRTRVYDKNWNSTYTKISKRIDDMGLNEIVQLFNVLKGDMSFVGPRAFIQGEELPEGKISEKRYLVKPGITGLAQVTGGRYKGHKYKLKCDEIYYDNFGFLQDAKILLLTPIEILKQIF